MKIAYNDEKYKQKLEKYDAIYVFDKEKLQDLIAMNEHCVHKNRVDYVDVNTTEYRIPCMKKMKITDDVEILTKKQNYKFAIIIPSYNNDHGELNGKTFFRNCLDSIVKQTYEDYELIIVDDMSTDTSISTAKEYIENNKDKKIHLIQNNKKRYNGGSRNVGIDYALKNTNCDYIMFCDSDDAFKDNNVLQTINDNLFNCEMMVFGLELLFPDGHTQLKLQKCDSYRDLFECHNKVWCTAWSRVIRKDKIVYFPEDTLMEDRVWAYEQADNVDFNNIINLQKSLYIWNRCNEMNSVSLVRGELWRASAYKHIGQQIMFMQRLKHKEMKPFLENRIKECIKKVNNGEYMQY